MNVEALGQNTWKLSGEVSLESLSAWQHELDRHVPADAHVAIHVGDLEFHGAAILPLLIHLNRRSGREGGSVKIENQSDRLLQIAEMSDLVDILGLR